MSETTLETEELIQLPLEEIFVNPDQPRRHFDAEELQELADSIVQVGLIHPPLVRKMEGCGGYELISGERRWRAAALAGMKKIPVIVCRASRALSARQALIENIQRVDLNPLEVARALKTLMEEFDLTQNDLSDQVGKKRSTIANHLRLLSLPSAVQRSLESGAISMGHAKAILALPSEEKQSLLHELILNDALSVRQAEEAARRLEQKAKKQRLIYTERDFYLEDLGRKIQEKLGTKVNVQGQGKKGRITLHYHNLDDLERLLSLLEISL